MIEGAVGSSLFFGVCVCVCWVVSMVASSKLHIEKVLDVKCRLFSYPCGGENSII